MQWLIGLSISVVALTLAFWGTNLAEVAAGLQQANYLYIVPALCMTLIAPMARALSWQAVLGRSVSFKQVFPVINEGYLLNNILPLRLGELARTYLISRRHPSLSVTQALSSILVERMVDLLVVVSLLAAFLPMVMGMVELRNGALVSLLLGVTLLVSLTTVAHQRARVLRLVRWTLARTWLAWLNPAQWEARAEAFLDGLAVLQDVRRSFWVVFWSMVAWVALGLSGWTWLLAFIPHASVEMGFFPLLVVALAGAVPSAPSAAGTFELAAVAALSLFNVERGLAITLHLLHFGVTCGLGGLALVREGETLAHLAQSAQGLVTRTDHADVTP
jgi:uncharacterized protein (TIRG00374 family)